MKKPLILVPLLALSLVAGACAGPASPSADGPSAAPEPSPSLATTPPGSPAAPAKPFDPRRDGFEIGLAEWAVTLESAAMRPGPVTFVIHNGGTRGHGFEIEAEGGDSSGHGSGDGFKTEGNLLQPGQTQRIELNLSPGVYKVECLVDGHDDLGMEILLEVRPDAPLVTPAAAAPDAVVIQGVKFQPPELTVPAGTEVTWTNQDPTAHTVTANDGSFDSDILEEGGTFRWTFETSGSVTYRCNIHPDMRGTITVE